MFQPARLSYDDLRAHAERFLSEFHEERTIPVPIEEIAEFDFDLEVRLLEGIQDDLEVDAFLAWSRGTIFIDKFIFEHRRRRARFSIAHELAHYTLHEKLYDSVQIDSVSDWRKIQDAISDEAYRWFEWQAYAMAGLVLVPPPELGHQFEQAVDKAVEEGLDRDLVLSDVGMPFVMEELADRFDASTAVIERRLEKDSLWRLTGGFEG